LGQQTPPAFSRQHPPGRRMDAQSDGTIFAPVYGVIA
jgi:hypothetical protein